MRLILSEQAWEDYVYWQKTDRRVAKRIHELIQDIQRNGNGGIGKPEPLKHALAGYWSRRIDQEHRLVYRIEGRDVLIAQLRYHY
jgi:toxin YoeB